MHVRGSSVARALTIVAVLAAAALLLVHRLDPQRPPWLWPALGDSVRLPASLDLTDAAEAGRWRPGRGVATKSPDAGGLTATGAGRDFHLSRQISVAPGQLGSVEIRTRTPLGSLRVTPYMGGKARPFFAEIAVPDPSDPYRLVAYFDPDLWATRGIEGLRIQPDDEATSIDLAQVVISSEIWGAVTMTKPESIDWPAAFAPAPAVRNVVLIVVDTLRADHTSLYGYERDTTPHLERLAQHGIVFEATRSQAACTFPSVNSLLTSQLPSRFLRQPREEWARLDRYRPIAMVLAESGLRTYAVSASTVVRATNSAHNNWGGGYDTGFDVFDESCAAKPAGCVNRRAVDLIDAGTGPFFLYVHYLDAHDPYRPPPSHEMVLPRAYSGREEFAHGNPNPIMWSIYRDHVPHGASARDVEHLMDLYDEEIRYLDEELQQLFIALYDRGLLGQTMIVLAADHGEEFLEHDHIKHCRSLYEPEVRTPLVFWIPGVEAPRRIGELAQNLDIVPTVLDYMGIEDEALQPVGRSLRRTIESGEPTNRYTFSAQDELQTVSDGPHKLIVDHGDESRQLFDLAADPLERVDLSGRRPEIEADLEQALRDYDQTSRSELLDRADRTHENLRALGYLE